MKLTTEEPQSEVVGESYDQSITISKESSYFIIKSLIDLYSDPIGSIVREIGSNMVDAHREKFKILEGELSVPSGYDPKYFEASKSKLPRIDINPKNNLTDTSATITFTDYGLGISPDRMEKIFTTMGQSTKRDTNEMIGAFGLGSKSPWTYTDAFYLTTVVSEVKYFYTLVFITGSVPEIKLLSTEKCKGEKNGVVITIPILKDSDVLKFLDSICKQLYFFTNIEIYNNSSLCTLVEKNASTNKLRMFLDTIIDKNVSNEKTVFTYNLIKTESLLAVRDATELFKKNPFKILVGKVIYPLDILVDDINIAISNSKFFSNSPICLRAKIGDVDLTPSRESLRYTEKTIKTIKLLIENGENEIETFFTESLQKIKQELYDIYYAPTYVEHINKKEEVLRNFIELKAINLINTFFDIGVAYYDILLYAPWNKMAEFFETLEEEQSKELIVHRSERVKLLRVFDILFKFLLTTYNIEDKNLKIIQKHIENAQQFSYSKPDKKEFFYINLQFFYRTSGNYILREYKNNYKSTKINLLNFDKSKIYPLKKAKEYFKKYLMQVYSIVDLKSVSRDLYEEDKDLKTIVIPKNNDKISSPLKTSAIIERLTQQIVKKYAGYYEEDDSSDTIIKKINSFPSISSEISPVKFLYKTKSNSEVQYKFFEYCESNNVLGDFYKHIQNTIQCDSTYLEDFYKTEPVLNHILKNHKVSVETYTALEYSNIFFNVPEKPTNLLNLFNRMSLGPASKVNLDINNLKENDKNKVYYFTPDQQPVVLFVAFIEIILYEFLNNNFLSGECTFDKYTHKITFYKVSEEFSLSLELEDGPIKNIFHYFKEADSNNSLILLANVYTILVECFQGNFKNVFPIFEKNSVPKEYITNIFNISESINSAIPTFKDSFTSSYNVFRKFTEIAIAEEEGLKSVITFFEECFEFLSIANVSFPSLVNKENVRIFNNIVEQEMPKVLKDFILSHNIRYLSEPVIFNNLKDSQKIIEYYDNIQNLNTN